MYVSILGKRLYSSDVTIESAYMELNVKKKEQSETLDKRYSQPTTEEKDGSIKSEHQEEAKKSATRAERTYFGTIDQAVEYLQECERNGKNVYVDFRGHNLYSCDVTIESAYMQVLGLTKREDEVLSRSYSQAETDEERETIIERGESIKKKHREEEAKNSATPAEKQSFSKVDEMVEYLQECERNGKNVYIETMQFRLGGDALCAARLYSCNVTLESAYMQIFGMTKAEHEVMYKKFWEARTVEERDEIRQKRDRIIRKNQEEEKNSATPAKVGAFEQIDEAVKYLEECRRNGENVYMYFNGYKLYSCDVTLDSAYMEIVGMTKAEDEAIGEEYRQAKTDEEREAIFAKWDSIRKGYKEAGGKKGSKTVLDSAIEATEETIKTSIINEQAQGIKDVSKNKQVEEMERVE